MRSKPAVRAIILLWLAWAILIIGFQAVVDWRMDPQRPDNVLGWTASETTRTSQNDQPYLIEDFMNHQVSWDSEFYLSIATVGYDDPDVRVMTARRPRNPAERTQAYSMNYAFMPVYPTAIRALAQPLRLFDLSAIARSTLAAVIVSLLGTLGAMLALYDLARDELGAEGGIRAAFYLLIFPSGFFLAQVYTEGLFVGLAFGSLALLHRKRWGWAALLAALATCTRAIGGLLIVPLALAWLEDYRRDRQITRRLIHNALLTLAPLGAYGVWWHALFLCGTPPVWPRPAAHLAGNRGLADGPATRGNASRIGGIFRPGDRGDTAGPAGLFCGNAPPSGDRAVRAEQPVCDHDRWRGDPGHDPLCAGYPRAVSVSGPAGAASGIRPRLDPGQCAADGPGSNLIHVRSLGGLNARPRSQAVHACACPVVGDNPV